MGSIEFLRTRDYSLIREIITHPKMYPYVSDDYSPSPELFRPIESDAIWYLLARENNQALGLWVLVPQNYVCWEVHTCILPSAWGAKAKQAATEAVRWVWTNSPCLRLITNVPLYNRLALRFAENAGLTRFGVNPQSYMKHGKLHDQIMLGISK